MSETENTQLAVRRPLTAEVWEMISAVAPAMYKSRLFGVSSAEQAIAVMMKGYELGLPITASFEFIDLITTANGSRPVLKPVGMLAILHDHPDCEVLEIDDIADDKGDPWACRVHMKRSNGFEHTIEFTMDDARRAGLVKPDSAWEKYPRNMLLWRATGFCADIVFPDIIGGMKRADELGVAVDESGDVIDGNWSIGPDGQPYPDEFAMKLEDLTDIYGPDAIMEAAGGTLPATVEELDTVALMLARAAHDEEVVEALEEEE